MKGSASALERISQSIPLTCDAKPGKTQSACTGQSACIEKIKHAMYASCAELGFEHIRYTCWISDTESNREKTNSFSINFSNFPADWECYYNSHKLHQIDPVVRLLLTTAEENTFHFGTWADALGFANKEPLGETASQKKRYCRQVQQLFDRAQEFGLHSGGYLSYSNHVQHIIVAFASREKTVNDNMLADNPLWKTLFSITLLVDQSIRKTGSCQHCKKSIRIDGSMSVNLTQKQADILIAFLEQRNATIKAVARKHAISVDTVNYHLKTMRDKLCKPGASGHALATFARDHGLI